MTADDYPICVSIGIPTYNRAGGYLREALKSALAQTYSPLEIIVSDNASTDDTESLVRSFNDPRIRYFRQKVNVPANENFNFCLDQAAGSYFVLLHDDDLLDPHMVQTCVDALDGRTDVGVVITGTRLIDGNGNELRSNPNRLENGSAFHEFVKGWFEHRVALYLCGTMYNTRFLKARGGYKSKHNLYQDVVATVHLAGRHGHRHSKTVAASFRRHADNRGSRENVLKWCEDCVYLLDIIMDLLHHDKREIEACALRSFSRQCYEKAKGIRNPITRLYTYGVIYKTFKFRYSPRQVLRVHEYPKMKALLDLSSFFRR